MTYSESSFSGTSNDTSIQLSRPILNQLSFRDMETICEEHFGARNWQKPLGLFCSDLNDDCSAQRLRELKLIPLNHLEMRILNMSLKIFLHVCHAGSRAVFDSRNQKQLYLNSNAKHLIN
jgi:hypothetical protein